MKTRYRILVFINYFGMVLKYAQLCGASEDFAAEISLAKPNFLMILFLAALSSIVLSCLVYLLQKLRGVKHSLFLVEQALRKSKPFAMYTLITIGSLYPLFLILFISQMAPTTNLGTKDLLKFWLHFLSLENLKNIFLLGDYLKTSLMLAHLCFLVIIFVQTLVLFAPVVIDFIREKRYVSDSNFVLTHIKLIYASLLLPALVVPVISNNSTGIAASLYLTLPALLLSVVVSSNIKKCSGKAR